jgi:hypothetical protein
MGTCSALLPAASAAPAARPICVGWGSWRWRPCRPDGQSAVSARWEDLAGAAPVTQSVTASRRWLSLRCACLRDPGVTWNVRPPERRPRQRGRHRSAPAGFGAFFLLQLAKAPATSRPEEVLQSQNICTICFYGSRLVIRLFKKMCENTKTIMIYLKYIQ